MNILVPRTSPGLLLQGGHKYFWIWITHWIAWSVLWIAARLLEDTGLKGKPSGGTPRGLSQCGHKVYGEAGWDGGVAGTLSSCHPEPPCGQFVASWYIGRSLGSMKEMLKGPSSSFFPGSGSMTKTGDSFLWQQKTCFRREFRVIKWSPESRCESQVKMRLMAMNGEGTASWQRHKGIIFIKMVWVCQCQVCRCLWPPPAVWLCSPLPAHTPLALGLTARLYDHLRIGSPKPKPKGRALAVLFIACPWDLSQHLAQSSISINISWWSERMHGCFSSVVNVLYERLCVLPSRSPWARGAVHKACVWPWGPGHWLRVLFLDDGVTVPVPASLCSSGNELAVAWESSEIIHMKRF